METSTSWTGVGTALVTPFKKNGAIDEALYRALARRQVDAGVHILVPCGTTGEAPTLTPAEKRTLVEIAIQESESGRRALVLAGAGGYDTREVCHAVAEMEKIGANGILSVTPYYNRPTQEGLFQHYRAIAESTSLPIILYNVPGRTGCNIEPATVLRLSAIDNIVGVKEASGNISQIAEICRIVPREFVVLSGDDVLTLPLMALGGRGIISVASNEAPEAMVQLVAAIERGDLATAQALNRRLMPLMQINFIESSPGPVKFAMAEMGLCEAHYRLPMVPITDASKAKVLAVLESLEMKGHAVS
jgi:4-hydroxy-tetrahydrodipicolinate synthase